MKSFSKEKTAKRRGKLWTASVCEMMSYVYHQATGDTHHGGTVFRTVETARVVRVGLPESRLAFAINLRSKDEK